MVYRVKTIRTLGASQAPHHLVYNQPPSVGGINTLDSLASMPPQDCIYTYNLMPSELGLRLRKGYKEHAAGLPSKVNSLIPFEGRFSDSSTDKLFAVCKEGIFDVSVYGTTAPYTSLVTFTNINSTSGFGVVTEFTSDAQDRYLYYADSENGLFQYNENTNLWSVPTFSGDLSGFNVSDVAYCFSWKNRMWFIQKDSGNAWFTEVSSIAGTVTKFTFGSKFYHGGHLTALYSWTIDGGTGVDDYLVALSRGGDVLVYRGEDPETASFQLVGSFYIGELPNSRRIAVNHGGELYILSTYGLTSLRDLLQGIDPSIVQTSASSKISRLLRNEVQNSRASQAWQLLLNPADGFLQIITPTENNEQPLQYNQNLLTKAWGMWRGVGVRCAAAWNGAYFMGSDTNVVWQYDGTVDNRQIAGTELWVDNTTFVGDGWSEPSPLTYTCDGSQTGVVSFLTIDTNVSAETPVSYAVSYVVTGSTSGRHALSYGTTGSTTIFSEGNGSFSGTLISQGVESTAQLVADSNFSGTITDVSLRKQGDSGSPIEFECLTSFQAPQNNPSAEKRVGIIRSIGYLAGTAALNVKAVYDYDLTSSIQPPAAIPLQGSSYWDAGIWDKGLWDYGPDNITFPIGAAGMGRVVAIGVRGSSSARISFIGWDVSYTQGGFL